MVNNMLINESKSNDDRFQRTIKDPELIFGIVGPIGVDIDSVVCCLNDALSHVKYESHTIHITKYAKDKK
jgi:hypothetical protein